MIFVTIFKDSLCELNNPLIALKLRKKKKKKKKAEKQVFQMSTTYSFNGNFSVHFTDAVLQKYGVGYMNHIHMYLRHNLHKPLKFEEVVQKQQT